MEKKKNSELKVAVSFNLPELGPKAILGHININQKDKFNELLKKINSVLDSHALTPIEGFHYSMEDADVTYVDKINFSIKEMYEDMTPVAPSERMIYVYYNY